jgi:pimeloyl-ACP methyl ester carboxylesterase
MKYTSPVRFALLLALGSLAGCSGAYQRLAWENSSPEHAALSARTAVDRRVTTRVAVDVPGAHRATLHLAVHETGAADAPRTLVFVHGVLSDSRVWRFLEGDLARDYRLLLIDLPGCGDSDKPATPTVPADFYSPGSLARCVLSAARQRLDAGNRRRGPITFVSHSLGGMIVHRMFGDDAIGTAYADVLERVDSVVAFAPPHVDIEREPELITTVARAGELDFLIGGLTGILRQRVAQAALRDAPEPRLMFREDCERLVRILADDATRRAGQAMLWRAVPNHSGKPDRQAVALLAADYPKVRPRHLIIWGREDDTLGPSMGHKIRDHLPDARLCVVTGARHTVPVERPGVSLVLIRDFLDNDLKSARRASVVSMIDGRTGRIIPTAPVLAVSNPAGH